MRKIAVKRPASVLSIIFVLFVFLSIEFSGGVDLSEYWEDGTYVTLTGKIVDKQRKEYSECIYISTNGSRDENEKTRDKTGLYDNRKYIIYPDLQSIDDFRIGQLITVSGKYKQFDSPENDGQFDSKRYYRIRGYEGSIKKGRIEKASVKYSRLRDTLFNIRERTKLIYSSNMSETGAGTLTAMVLGDKSDLNSDIKELYQSAGISHILSLSGLHIATVGMALFSLLSKTGIGLSVSSIISSLIMLLYAVMTGFSTSTFRAFIMFALGIIAKNIGRTYDLLSAAYFSVILILIENPYLIYDSGFQMSFLSVAGIGMLYPVLFSLMEVKRREKSIILSENPHRLSRLLRKIYESDYSEKLRQSICVSMSATLMTAPVVISSYYKISRYSVFINLIIVPLMGIILSIGIVSGIIGNIFGKFYLCSFFVRILLKIADEMLTFYSYAAEKISGLSHNTWIVGKGEKWQIIVYISLLLGVYAAYEMKINSRMITSMVIMSAMIILTVRMKPDFEIDVLSVGQGACNVIYGKHIPVIVIDGGSTDVKNVGKYRIEPFLMSKGIDEIDYLFITHPDADHMNGIEEILNMDSGNIRIRHLFMSVYDEQIFKLARALNVKTHIMGTGDIIKRQSIEIECLSPGTDKDFACEMNYAKKQGTEIGNGDTELKSADSKEKDINDLSLVLLVKYSGNFKNKKEHRMAKVGFKALFTGDISSEVEKQLINNVNTLEKIAEVNFMTVAHHGSRYSSCEQFLETTASDIYTISSGKDNSYGHPHKETLERLEKNIPAAKVLRTDECGQVTVVVGEKVQVKQFRYGRHNDK